MGDWGSRSLKNLKETLDSNYWLRYFKNTNSEERILNCVEPERRTIVRFCMVAPDQEDWEFL